MLARCRAIEANPVFAVTKTLFEQRYEKKENIKEKAPTAIGILNADVGSGKTYAILSLIATDDRPTLTVIVTPKNIHHQWREAINTIFPDKSKMPWTVCTEYRDIMDLNMNPDHFAKYRIVLMDVMFVDAFSLANTTKVHRVVVDEIDNLQTSMTQSIDAAKTWFMSASFDPQRHTEIGPYQMNPQDVYRAVCCCDPAFIAESISLEQPSTEIITCDDAEVRLFDAVAFDNVITALHAGNIQPLLNFVSYTGPTNACGSYEDIAKMYVTKVEQRVKTLQADMQNDRLTEKLRAEAHQEFCKVHKVLGTMNTRLINYKPSPKDNTKEHAVGKLIERIQKEEGSKWLFMNDDYKALMDFSNRLDGLGIKCAMLDGGSADAVQKTLVGYKNGDIRVLLLNSTKEGCGLNLEQTTHIVLMHAFNPSMVAQVVGRAQRYGRTGRLHVIGLFNSSELDRINNGGILR